MKKLQCRLAALIDAHNLRVSETGKGDRVSQRGLARSTGLSTTTINRMCQSTATRFDAKAIEKICKALDVEPGDLLVLVDEEGGDDQPS